HHLAFEAGERRRVARWVNDGDFGGFTRDLRCSDSGETQRQKDGQARNTSHAHQLPLLRSARIQACFHRSAIRVTSASATCTASSGLDRPVTTLMNIRGVTKLVNTSL